MYYNYLGKDYRLILFHYPIASWNGRFRNSIHLHGHTHNSDIDNDDGVFGHILNVSVEHLNYIPISFDEVINKFKDVELKKV